jgi:hypothetical protein
MQSAKKNRKPSQPMPMFLQKQDFLDVLPRIVQDAMKTKSSKILLWFLSNTDTFNCWNFDSICVHLLVHLSLKKAAEIINALLSIYLNYDSLSFISDPIISQRWAIIKTFAQELLKCQRIRFIPRAMMFRRSCTRFSINLSLSQCKIALFFSRKIGKKDLHKMLTLSGWIGFFLRRLRQLRLIW